MNPIFAKNLGNGKPVILLHGFCESHEIWETTAQALASTYHVFAPDLPGFGKSTLPDTPFSISDIAQLLLDWIKSTNIENPVVIGHSLGGYVALAAASQNPALFSGLGLFHSTAFADTPQKIENRNKAIDFVNKNGVQPYVDTLVAGLFHQKDNAAVKLVHSIASATPKETIIGYCRAMRDRPDTSAVLKTLEVPTLLIAGEFDTFVSVEDLQVQAATCRRAHFYTLANVGHMGMFEDGANSIKMVKNFLDVCF